MLAGSRISVACAVAAAIQIASASPDADLVSSLPLFPKGKSLPKSWAGYLDADGGNKQIFYWLFAPASGKQPKALVQFYTGGPGCDMAFSETTEMGPIQVQQGPDGPQVSLRPVHWAEDHALLFFSSPCGVGFSYAKDGNYTTGDDVAAATNLDALVSFYGKFPELLSVDLVLAGESYSGHTVPLLVTKVQERNSKKDAPRIPLTKFMVGNPSFDSSDGSRYFDFMRMHALVSGDTYDRAVVACNGSMDGGPGHHSQGGSSPACEALREQMRAQLVGINPYNVLARCNAAPSPQGGCFTMAALTSAGHPLRWEDKGDGLGSQTVVPCINVTAQVDYFRRADVRSALHVRPESFEWDVCSPHISFRQYLPTMAPYYHRALADSGTPVSALVYSGTSDSCVNTIGTEYNINGLGYPPASGNASGPFQPRGSRAWRTWGIDGQVAGYVRGFDVPPARGQEQAAVGGEGGDGQPRLQFAAVKGVGKPCGHMVPGYCPEEAFALMSRFVAGEAI